MDCNVNAVTLVAPTRKELFSHKTHSPVFANQGIQCTDCHTFAVKTTPSDPTGAEVKKGFLAAPNGICHHCHLGKISMPVTNQCNLCHKDTKEIMPKSHSQNWLFRHGHIAEMDSDSCLQCHSPKTCTQCHTQRDTMKPSVHRPGFRVFHSIEARGNPQSCTVCHSNTSFCLQCHTKGMKQ